MKNILFIILMIASLSASSQTVCPTDTLHLVQVTFSQDSFDIGFDNYVIEGGLLALPTEPATALFVSDPVNHLDAHEDHWRNVSVSFGGCLPTAFTMESGSFNINEFLKPGYPENWDKGYLLIRRYY